MKWFLLLGAMMAVGCAAEEQQPSSDVQEQPIASERADEGATSSQERWCNSYKSEEYCPKRVCVWHVPADEEADAYCGLPLDR